MAKKNKKKEIDPILGNIQVMEIYHFNLFSRQLPIGDSTRNYVVLELNGDALPGSTLETIQLIFLPENAQIRPAVFHDPVVVAYQPLNSYNAFMDMVAIGIESDDKYAILYGFYNPTENIVDVYLASGLGPVEAYLSLQKIQQLTVDN